MSDKDAGTPRVYLARHGIFSSLEFDIHFQSNLFRKARQNGPRMADLLALLNLSSPRLVRSRCSAQVDCLSVLAGSLSLLS